LLQEDFLIYSINLIAAFFFWKGKRRLKDLLLQSDNRFCADCGAPDPKWA
jgi:hypothetical protein